MKMILFNGPPRSGKDTAAKFLHFNYSSVTFERFSAPNKLAFAATVGANYNDYLELDWYEEHKGEKLPQFGVSYRQWQIDFAERFMKPLYGKHVFARAFLQRLDSFEFDDDSVVVVPDCGFQIEVDECEKVYSADQVLLVKLFRDGCDFKGDSREYVKSDVFKTINVSNNSTEKSYEDTIDRIYKDFLNGNV